MSYYLEPGSHIRDKVKVVLDLSKYTPKKELHHASGVDTSDLVAKKYFISLKADLAAKKDFIALKTEVN